MLVPRFPYFLACTFGSFLGPEIPDFHIPNLWCQNLFPAIPFSQIEKLFKISQGERFFTERLLSTDRICYQSLPTITTLHPSLNILVMCVCKKDHNLVKSVKHEKNISCLTVVLLSNWICIILCCVQSVVVAIWF